MTPPLRFALVGCGSIASTHARALADSAGRHTGVCTDLVPERATAFADGSACAPADWTRILADRAVDAVTVCAPSGLHAALGVQALRAGKHVIVEKPMDVSLAACDALIAAQRDSGRTLAVISQHRFDRASLVVSRRWTRGCSATWCWPTRASPGTGPRSIMTRAIGAGRGRWTAAAA